ncbi:MAG: hypothetical protein LBT04_05565 [Prevotellaceae bacterium]|jgi:hypothetical protein|nr:hypothetical protein [Prevotellaceae bacterium]
MKKTTLKSLAIIFLLLCISSNGVYAQQQKTAYEKKISEITQKYFEILYGYNKRLSVYEQLQLDAITNGDDAKEFILGIGILGYAANHTTDEVKRMATQIENDLKAAEKLKTSVDFQREKELKALQAQKELEKSDYGSIQKSIKTDFQSWNQKGEFEKQTDYEERLKTQSQETFVSTCIKNIKKKVENFGRYDYPLKKELLKYDSENESFSILFKFNGKEWQNNLKIPITDAEGFKSKWSNLEWQKDEYDWCVIENSLFPTTVTLQYNAIKYTFKLPLQNQTEISYPFNDLEIENMYLKGYVFKYSDAKAMDLKIAREKFIADSLETMSYNNKLETALQDYNNQLLVNPHNIEKTVIFEYEKVKAGKDKENSHQSSLNSLKRNFENINNNLERNFTHAYSDVKQLFQTKEEFEQFYAQGKDILQEEIAKRTEKQEKEKVLNYLQANSKFIELMDFQKEKSESVGSALGRGLLGVATSTNVSSIDYSNENKAREQILSLINNTKDKAYYPQVIDLVVETNKKLNKEYAKSGEYFENKVKFYESFLSANYKDILKEKKKK